MKALYFDGALSLRETELPQRGSGEALVAVTLAGICGTDRQILRGYSGFRGIPGHEFVGEVVECDDDRWIGKRVVGEINVSCGSCEWCRRGLGRHCQRRTVLGIVNRPGAFADFVALPAANLHEIPQEVPDEAAVFTEPLAAACEILEQAPISPGTRVAVLGDGRLGLLVAQVLRHAQAQVTVIGHHDSKLNLARAWGMSIAYAGKHPIAAKSFTVVVEATGSPQGLDQALRIVEPRGTVVMKSTFHEAAHFDTAKLVVDEITLLGSRCGNFPIAVDLLRNKYVIVQALVSRIFPLEAGLEAFRYLEQTPCLKVLLAPGVRGGARKLSCD
jgi:2-desacetyl-2-hydroxyethyl bacteriochlorophyllide A dehydrogenase